MQTLKEALSSKAAVAVLTVAATAVGSALATHYPSLWASVCLGKGGF